MTDATTARHGQNVAKERPADVISNAVHIMR
jgi:hypothetical protein